MLVLKGMQGGKGRAVLVKKVSVSRQREVRLSGAVEGRGGGT